MKEKLEVDENSIFSNDTYAHLSVLEIESIWANSKKPRTKFSVVENSSKNKKNSDLLGNILNQPLKPKFPFSDRSLIPEYYNDASELFCNELKLFLGEIYDINVARNQFIDSEIAWILVEQDKKRKLYENLKNKKVQGKIELFDQEQLIKHFGTLSMFKIWLESKKMHEMNKESHKESKIEVIENPHPNIFKNQYAYQMFLDLKNSTVKQKTIVADYSFIFHKMNDKSIEAINSFVTEPAFIKFLNKYHNAQIDEVKLPFRNPKNKEPLYAMILNKYQANILE